MKPKDTVILHIGMHKTATKSIQSALQKAPVTCQTRYASLGLSNHSIPLMTAFRSDPHNHYYYVKRGIGEEECQKKGVAVREKLIEELRSPERNLILSGEELLQIRPSDLQGMKAFLQQYCDRFRVLAYIREPVGLASSFFQQLVRHGRVTELKVINANYEKRLNKFIEIFGREVIEFTPFDKDRLQDGCIITDFCERVGIDATQIAKEYKNQSLSTEVVALLLSWNQHGNRQSGSPLDVTANSRLIALLRQEFPGKFRISRSLVISEIDENDREWMEKQSGFSLLDVTVQTQGVGVQNDAELEVIAINCVPRLATLLAARSLTATSEHPAALLDSLYSFERRNLKG